MSLTRSLLSVPGHRETMHAKALTSDADIIMFDLEDAVPIDQKEQARHQVIQTLVAIDNLSPGKTLAVRINDLTTPFAFRDALEIGQNPKGRLSFIVLPKVNHEGDIHFLDRLLTGIELEKRADAPLKIEAAIETAQGLERVSAIARASSRMRALSFGVADYTASIGACLTSLSGHDTGDDTTPGHRWHYAVSRMVMAAKAAGLIAMDSVFGDFKDPAGLERSAAMGKALGCNGKWVIHPDQIAPVNQIFSPSPQEIARADRILHAAESASGRGAVAVDGKMVDQATISLARQIRSQADALKAAAAPKK